MAKLIAVYSASFPDHSSIHRLDFLAEVDVELPEDVEFREGFRALRAAARAEARRISRSVGSVVPEISEAGHDGV
jgi:hypothetical protein